MSTISCMTTHKTFESILNWETLDYSYVKRSNALTWQKRQPKKDNQPHPALLLFKMAAQRGARSAAGINVGPGRRLSSYQGGSVEESSAWPMILPAWLPLTSQIYDHTEPSKAVQGLIYKCTRPNRASCTAILSPDLC